MNGGMRTSFPQNSQSISHRANEMANQNAIQVEIQNWQNASKEDLVSFISRKTKIGLQNVSVDPISNAIKAFVRSQKDAISLEGWSGVRFAGNSLKISVCDPKVSQTNFSQGTTSTIDLLKGFLKSRYNPQAKMLDLTEMINDPTLVSNGLFATASTSSKMFPALMKLAGQEKLVVETVNLARNNFNDGSSSNLSVLGSTFPNLKNLSLESNQISKSRFFESCKNKFYNLRELVVINNPITTQQPTYKLDLVNLFPMLVVLDGEVLRDEARLSSITKLPVANQQSLFFENPDIQSLATGFISNYLKLWDANRMDLLSLYSPESQFSYQVDSLHPSLPLENSVNPSQAWNYYLGNSRNLARISNERSRMARLYKGVEPISKIFQSLPKTLHRLLEAPQNFAIEAWSYAQIGGILIVCHGEFEEVDKPENPQLQKSGGMHSRIPGKAHHNPLMKRSFDRTFVVVPGPNNSMIVASDMLLIRYPAGTGPWAPSVPDSVTAHVPAHVTASVPGANQQPTPADLISKLPPIQQQILEKVFTDTKLNMEFSYILCEQVNWDYNAAIMTFKTSHEQGQIPANAFQ